MKKYLLAIISLIIISQPLVSEAKKLDIAARLAGRILLDVQGKGEAWYVNPKDNKRYYLGRPTDAFRVMRELAVGMTNRDLAKIETSSVEKYRATRVAGAFEAAAVSSSSSSSVVATSTKLTATTSATKVSTSTAYDIDISRRMAGNILLQVEGVGEAWYINPTDLKKYYLGRPEDAFKVMRELSLGVSKEDLAFIHKPGLSESIDQYSKYEHKSITLSSGQVFKTDIIEINLDDPNLKIITDTANPANCKSNCQAKPLIKYVADNKAFAGLNATYFCDSSGCIKNYYFYPVYNSNNNVLINEDQLKYWTTGPIMVFDVNNKFYYFKDSREFKSVAEFEKQNGVKIQAALGNRPRLIEDKMNLLIEWDIDKKQRDSKAARNAMAYIKGETPDSKGKVYLVIVYNATVPDLANVMQAMNVDYALNLDGGYSTAMVYNGEYMAGPGRDIPNVIMFGKKNY